MTPLRRHRVRRHRGGRGRSGRSGGFLKQPTNLF